MGRILVTGGAGFIGSNIVKRLDAEGFQVVVADNLWRGKLENLYECGVPAVDPVEDFYKVDLCDYGNCIRVPQDVEVVFHLADIVAGINYVFSNERFLYRSNILMNSNILAASIKNRVKKFIYVGTACSYPAEMQSSVDPPPFKEEDVYPANPESSYGWSKLMGEYECELAMKERLMNIGLLRLHNVYGPPCEMSPEKSQVIPALCRKAIRFPSEPFIVWGSGQQRRAFVYVKDVIDALLAVMEKGMGYGAIQIGPGESTSIARIAETIARISGKHMKIEFDHSKPEGDKGRTADWSKAERILGWRPTVCIEEGLEHTYRWCKDHLRKKADESV